MRLPQLFESILMAGYHLKYINKIRIAVLFLFESLPWDSESSIKKSRHPTSLSFLSIEHKKSIILICFWLLVIITNTLSVGAQGLLFFLRRFPPLRIKAVNKKMFEPPLTASSSLQWPSLKKSRNDNDQDFYISLRTNLAIILHLESEWLICLY